MKQYKKLNRWNSLETREEHIQYILKATLQTSEKRTHVFKEKIKKYLVIWKRHCIQQISSIGLFNYVGFLHIKENQLFLKMSKGYD